MRLEIVPITLRAAQEFVEQHHRHNKPPQGCKFAVGVMSDGSLAGVATAGRPIARALDDGRTLEITRTCTIGSRNANSMLYGACKRAGKAMGYLRAISYTQGEEDGASLRAAGFVKVRETDARGDWTDASVSRKAITRSQISLIEDHRQRTGGVPRAMWECLL